MARVLGLACDHVETSHIYMSKASSQWLNQYVFISLGNLMISCAIRPIAKVIANAFVYGKSSKTAS